MSDSPRRHKKLTISDGHVAATVDETPINDVVEELLGYVEPDEEVIEVRLKIRKKSQG